MRPTTTCGSEVFNELKRRVGEDPGNPRAWLALVNFIHPKRPMLKNSKKLDYLLKALDKAIKNIPAHSNINNDDYIELWLHYVALLRVKDPNEAREAYEHMALSRIGLDVASFWVTWAELEFADGRDQTAGEILKKGMAHNAMPHSVLLQAEQRLRKDELAEFRHIIEMPYRASPHDVIRTPLLHRNKQAMAQESPMKAAEGKGCVPQATQDHQLGLQHHNCPQDAAKRVLPTDSMRQPGSLSPALRQPAPRPPVDTAPQCPATQLLAAGSPQQQIYPGTVCNNPGTEPTPPVTPITLPSVCITLNNVQFAVLQEIGRGGSSKVVKALSPNYQVVAIKTVRYHEQRDFDLYMKEVECLHRFHGNPHIIQLMDHEVDRRERVIKMVLELGEIDLHKLLVQHRKSCGATWRALCENTLRHYWEQMLEAVHQIHEGNVIHTDLKPANFLMVQGRLKLIDFGIADHLDDDCTSIERDCALGTPSYLSPEACTAGPKETWGGSRCKVGRPADVWSLGIILYQLVYGVTPFCKVSKYHKMLAIPDPKFPIDWYPIRNGDLLDVMQQCLQRDPKARPTIPSLLQHPFLHPASMAIP